MNAKQERFVAEYLLSLNATQAAIKAGYSDKAAAQIGSRLLRKAEIRAVVAKCKDVQLAKREINADWVLDKLVAVEENTELDFARLKALEMIGKHVKVSAFQRDAQPVGVLLVLRDYTGRSPAPTEVDVTPIVTVIP